LKTITNSGMDESEANPNKPEGSKSRQSHPPPSQPPVNTVNQTKSVTRHRGDEKGKARETRRRRDSPDRRDKEVSKGKGRAASPDNDTGEDEVTEESNEDLPEPKKLNIFERTRSHSRAHEEEKKSAQKNLLAVAGRSVKKTRVPLGDGNTSHKVIIDLTGDVRLIKYRVNSY
jgi:hypothetical protein